MEEMEEMKRGNVEYNTRLFKFTSSVPPVSVASGFWVRDVRIPIRISNHLWNLWLQLGRDTPLTFLGP